VNTWPKWVMTLILVPAHSNELSNMNYKIRSMKLLNGDFHPGDTIQVEPGTDGLTFRAK
jgi:hypothetical protein